MTEYMPTTETVREAAMSDGFAGIEPEDFDRWLTAHDSLVRAEAWDEGLSAGADRWMDSREFGDPPVNPYRIEGGGSA